VWSAAAGAVAEPAVVVLVLLKAVQPLVWMTWNPSSMLLLAVFGFWSEFGFTARSGCTLLVGAWRKTDSRGREINFVSALECRLGVSCCAHLHFASE
jgi:hypothetical protein